MQVTGAEARATQISILTAALALAHQVAAKSLREGVFLATFSVTQLPWMMLGTALASIPTALLVARLMGRWGPTRLAPALFLVNGLAAFSEWWLLPSAPRAIAIAVYLHVSIGGALVVSAFWSIINECFDPHTLKKVVGRIGASCTLGGLAGGLLMERAAHSLSARTGLLVIGGLALAAALSTRLLAGAVSISKPSPEEPQARERITGYLRTLALLVAGTAAASAFGDFALKQAAVARFSSMETLVRFFAVFYTAASLVSFLIQALLSRRVLDTIGVGPTLSLPPLLGVALGGISLFSPSLVTIGALRGGDLALGPSLFRSAYEPLFTPIAAASKRRSKALIDVVFDKGGAAFASVLILAILSGGQLLIQRAPLVLAIAASALTVFLSTRAQRSYVVALEGALRAGTLHEHLAFDDDTRRLLLSATSTGIDRDKLLQHIARIRQGKVELAEPVQSEEERKTAPPEPLEQVVSDVRVLVGSDVRAILAVLARPELDARLAAFVVPHLGQDELVNATVQALRAMGHGALGVLAEAMLSSSQPAVVRRRVPHVLRSGRGDRVVRTLFWALSADAIEVRYRAALALAEVTRDDKDLLPDRQQIYALALLELARGPLQRAAIDHVFALLALGLDRGAAELARQGVLSEDPKLRGTALEYLESLLPESVRMPLVAALAGFAGPREQSVRKQADGDPVAELKRSFRADLASPSLGVDPD